MVAPKDWRERKWQTDKEETTRRDRERYHGKLDGAVELRS